VLRNVPVAALTSAYLLTSLPFSAPGTFVPQVVSYANLAALTALSTTSGAAVWTVAMSFPMAGLNASRGFPLPSTHSLRM
jgi:hypothetical protein